MQSSRIFLISNRKERVTDGTMPETPLDLRLQQLITGWRGGQRGEALMTLHTLCVESAGRDNPLLPARLYPVQNLDAATLREKLKQTSATVRFAIPPHGRFDAALVPTGKVNGPLDRFVFAVEATLSIQDQVALYAHAVGHLLLNHQARLLERGLNLDPDSGFTHVERLAELRYVETVRNPADRRVLESFPGFTRLIEPPEESSASFEAATQDVQQRLLTLGWSKAQRLLFSPYTFTAGRVLPLPDGVRRGRRHMVDILLRASYSLPIAVVHTQRAGEASEDAQRRAQDAATRLGVPFAYVVALDGSVHEFDYTQGTPPTSRTRTDLPVRDELVKHWLTVLQLTTRKQRETLFYPYEQNKFPRYYQEAAINRALIAILQAKEGLREKRILLTLATGTGKTRVAFQLLWKLKQTRAVGNILFLADRTYLLNQAANNEFAPFREAIWRAEGESKTSRDLVFASYQWLTTRDRAGVSTYEKYEPAFFDVIVIDECHRGSASEDSQWRRVLDYFSGAVQVGLTATPLKSKDVQTRQYFGEEVYSYSLSRAINDGYLAPYRVRRILIGPQAESGDAAAPGEPRQRVLDPFQSGEETSELAEALVMETASTMRKYTQAIAEHLAKYLEQTDRRAKTIVFCVDNEHAAAMRDALRTACSGVVRPEEIVRIVDDDGMEGQLALSEFCAVTTQRPVIVTTSRLLSTGIDAPMCKNIVLARGVGSMVEFKQIIGRGTRLFGHEKTWFTILDYAGAIKHFFDPDFDGNPEFIVNEPLVPQPAPAEPEKPADNQAGGDPAQANQTGQTAPGEFAGRVMREQPLVPEQESGEAPELPDSRTIYAFDLSSTSSPAGAKTAPAHAQYEASDRSSPPSGPPDSSVEPGQPAAPGENDNPTEKRPALGRGAGRQRNAGARPSPARSQPNPAEPIQVVKRREDGITFVVQGEMLFELNADGYTLRSRPGREWARLTLQQVVKTPEELRARWIMLAQRTELLQLLDDQIVPIEALAATMNLVDVDPLDVLLQALFDLPALTRAERVARLRQQQRAFFARIARNPLAARIIDAILEKYMDGTAPDVSDIGLLRLQPIANWESPGNLALALKGDAPSVKAVLQELQRLLYSV
jgi:type I site-specific restriction endonuclease